MLQIGKVNRLRILKAVDFGIYLDGGQAGEILMPMRYVPANISIDDDIDAFIYLDSEDRLIATTEKPLVQVEEFAYLKVVEVNRVGVFLDWGLPKDLLLPFKEQNQTVQEGDSVMVYVKEDQETRRIIATSRTEPFLDRNIPEYEVGQEVDLIIYQRTDLGYKAIINQTHTGILYYNQVFQLIKIGQHLKGYIQQMREDYKIDLSLYKLGYEKVGEIASEILERIRTAGGYLPVSDKSPAEQIYTLFGCSKKTYKKAIGELYKKRLIALEDEGVRVV